VWSDPPILHACVYLLQKRLPQSGHLAPTKQLPEGPFDVSVVGDLLWTNIIQGVEQFVGFCGEMSQCKMEN
jgi:hypothetical protein